MKNWFFLIIFTAGFAYADLDRSGNVIHDGSGGSAPGWVITLVLIGFAGWLAYDQGEKATLAKREAYDAHQEVKRLRSELVCYRALQKTVTHHLDGETTEDEFFDEASKQLDAIRAISNES
jgi:hypothetical protein